MKFKRRNIFTLRTEFGVAIFTYTKFYCVHHFLHTSQVILSLASFLLFSPFLINILFIYFFLQFLGTLEYVCDVKRILLSSVNVFIITNNKRENEKYLISFIPSRKSIIQCEAMNWIKKLFAQQQAQKEDYSYFARFMRAVSLYIHFTSISFGCFNAKRNVVSLML